MVDDVDNREDGGDEDDKSRDGKGVLEKFFCGSPLQASFNSINCPMPAFELHFLPYSTQFSAKNILELDLQIIKLPSVQIAICDSRSIVHWCSWAYLIFVISFTQTGFSKTKFYTQKND